MTMTQNGKRKTELKVLLVEDDEADVDYLKEILSEEKRFLFDVVHVDRLNSARERLAHGGIDVVLLDLSLPDSEGFDSFAHIQEDAMSTPIIVLTGLDDDLVGLL